MAHLDDLKTAYPEAADHIDLVPPRMRDAVCMWLLHGTPPGHFLAAVVCNDLCEAVGRAGEINRAHLRDWVSFFYNYTPGECWGSSAKAVKWKERGGLRGRKAAGDEA